MPTETPVPKDSPLMKAWETYTRTEEYENTRKWARIAYHTDGSLWAAFLKGWEAAAENGAGERAPVRTGAPAPASPPETEE